MASAATSLLGALCAFRFVLCMPSHFNKAGNEKRKASRKDQANRKRQKGTAKLTHLKTAISGVAAKARTGKAAKLKARRGKLAEKEKAQALAEAIQEMEKQTTTDAKKNTAGKKNKAMDVDA